MSFSARNVSQLLVGTTAKTIATLVDVGDYAVIGIANVGATTGDLVNKGVRVTVKTSRGMKVSDFVPVSASYVTDTITDRVLGASTATYADPASFASKTFFATIDKHDDQGSPLNDRFISAYVPVDADGNLQQADGTSVVASAATIVAELDTLLSSTVKKEGDEFTISSATNVLTVTETAADQIVGVKDGINLPWELTGGYKDEAITGGSYHAAPAAIAVTAVSTASDLVQLKNVEWFNSGFDKDPYREAGFPASFQVDSNISAAGVALGDAYGIFQFTKDRVETNVERQHKQLIAVGILGAAINTALTAVTV